ncbi:putative DNA-binding domain protein [Vibrio phage vB_VpS_PG28]|nr:putative DNA-binding domain protein [Vibrio phage vB_VpS_PG28]
MADAKEGFKKWYSENKGSLSQRRKNRYETDPEYRAKVKERARKASAKRREENRGVLTRKHGDQVFTVVKLSTVAEKCGLTTKALRVAEGKGEIPPTSFEGTHRVYTPEQCDLIIKYFAKEITTEEVFAQWESSWQ